MNELQKVSFYGTTQDTLQYIAALGQLDFAQQKAVLSLHGYNSAQQESILKMSLGIAKLQEYTVAKLADELNTNANTLAEKLNAKANDQLTASMIKQLTVTGALKPLEAQRLLSLIQQTGATVAADAATKKYTFSMKQLATVMMSTPMGWITILTTLLPIAIAGVKKLYEYFQNQVVTLEELTNEYQQQQEKLEDLNGEYDKNAERIKELNGLKTSGEITLAQEEELKRLQRQNDLLDAQILMYDELNKSKKVEISNKAVAQAQQFFSGETVTEDAWGVQVGEDSGIVKLERAMERYQNISKQIEEETAKGADADQEALSNLEANKREQLKIMTELSDEMQNYASSIDATDPANKELIDMLDLNINKVTLLVGGVQAFETVWNRLWSDSSPVQGAEEAAKKLGEAADAQARWNEELKKYGSNVDLTNRKILKGSDLAGNDIFNGIGPDDYATLYSHTYTAADFGGKGTEVILVTPILPDGTVFESKKDLEDYVISLMKADGSGFDLSKDTKGITLGLFDEGSIDASIEKADRIAIAAHEANQAFDELYQSGTVQQVISLLEEMGVDISEMPIGEFAAMFEKVANSTQNAAENTQHLVDSLATLETNYKLVQSAQEEFNSSGGFTANTLKSIVEKFPDLADNVDEYISGLKTGKELLADLSAAYQTDVDNYKKSIVAKLAASPEFYQKLLKNQKTAISDLCESYQVDLKNYKSLEEAKLKAQSQIIQRMLSNYSQYQNATIESLRGMPAVLAAKAQHATSTAERDKILAEYYDVIDTLNALNRFNKAMEDISLDGLDFNISDYSGSSSKSSKAVEAYVADIEKYRDALKRLNDVQEEAAAIQEKMDNSQDVREQILLQKQLIGVYGQEQEALSTLNKLRDQTITENVKKLQSLGFAVQYNAESDELWISNMERLNQLTATSKGKYETLQEATNALRKDTEELIKTTEELNDANKDGSSEWRELGYSIRDAKESVFELLDTMVQNASDAVDAIQDVYDTLHDAADEYAESGYITVDTLQSIVGLGTEYLSYLRDENGQLTINEESIRKVIAAKAEQMAVQSALSYVEALSIAKRDDDIESLNRLLTATTEATNATWGLVYAQLKRTGLSGEEYKAALANINALRAMADSAITNIGKVSSKVKSELESMQSGVNDILEYVMDMLKQKINDQVQALEDMKTEYGDIIARKKESLQLSQKEANRAKDMASKMKQMAKLQAQIDLLGLDGSREAKVQQAALMEELAEIQAELTDTQNEYAVESQEDALDKMQSAYEEERDKEIGILEDSISSYQKLYDMAISYISDNWDTLYDQLIDWNTQYGDNLNDEITSAWENCLSAAQKYGSYVSALKTLPGDIEASGSGNNLNLGNTSYDDTSSVEDEIHAIIREMYSNMQEHGGAGSSTSPERKSYLSQRNLELGDELHQYGVMAYRSKDPEDYGTWYTDSTKRQKLFDAYRKYIYHSGGFAGETGTLQDNEILGRLEKGETILTKQMWGNVTTMVENVDKLIAAFSKAPLFGNADLSSFFKFGASGTGGSTTNNVTNSQDRVSIEIGETKIYGANNDTVQKHITVTRDMVDQIARLLGVRR